MDCSKYNRSLVGRCLLPNLLSRWDVAMLVIALQVATLSAAEPDAAEVQFNRDIRPILTDRCFICHGPDRTSEDAQSTGLRLDLRESAVDDYGAIEPGDAEASELLARISSDDPDLVMPPVDSHKTRLTSDEVELFRQWINEGAEYQKHWAFVPPMRPTPPQVKLVDRVTSPIDAFVLARLQQEALAPSPEADRRTLIRRVTFDLTGLPPTLAEVAAFVNDPAPQVKSYEKVVDRLLASNRYGEQMSRYWLDAARFADTSGYQYDRERKQWVWRDWVIHAFNTNMPFDRFTIEQMAGDLLPDATDQARLATGFHRNHPITIEGGVIEEEYRTEYVIDRVVTTSNVWLGQTMLCARCHDHKYDPISQEDFYRFFAFFNNVEERGVGGKDFPSQFEPMLKVASPLASEDSGSTEASDYPPTMVMVEMQKPRTAYVLERGEYDKPQKDKPLVPGLPEALGTLPDGSPTNRLTLAYWLVSRENPLTARVTVNRLWQQVFGIGLVKTSEDFGSQGEWPSHPNLLDWLAVEFMESDWDVKNLMKTIVMSSTYRQSSTISKSMHARDPENRLLTHGPRFRLDGEVLRDSALAVSGLLNRKVGGPSVYPYHPNGLWIEINNRPNYSRPYPHPTDRAQLYRRSMYTFWKRTVPPPSMATLDAPAREYCVVRRSRTNTPLQAFVMLHDPQFVEAARQLAAQMMFKGGETIESRIEHGYTLCTARAPSADEMKVLRKTFDERLAQYLADSDAATKFLMVGQSPRDESLDISEHAAYTQVARILLNLSEFLTKG